MISTSGKPSSRDQAPALVPFYASNVDDLQIPAPAMGTMRIYGKGQRVRQVPVHLSIPHDRLPY